MKDLSRQSLLKTGLLGGVAVMVAKLAHGSYRIKRNPTPREIKGPFYPGMAQEDKDFDLTRIAGRKEAARGEAVIMEGIVLDTNGNPVHGATVDLWQANAAGRYRHPHDPNKAPLDPNFQGGPSFRAVRSAGFDSRRSCRGPIRPGRTGCGPAYSLQG
jgi:protocatechuate 3,4-dioxygenase beta subunit